MIGRPPVTSGKSRCCVVLPGAKGEKGNMDILGTTRLLFASLSKPFSSRFPSNFFQECILQHGWYDSSFEEKVVSEAVLDILRELLLRWHKNTSSVQQDILECVLGLNSVTLTSYQICSTVANAGEVRTILAMGGSP